MLVCYLVHAGQFRHQYEEGESPLDHLQQAAYCYASAIKIKGKDHHLHVQLGQILEERYYAEDMFGLKKQVRLWFYCHVCAARKSLYHLIF